MTGCLRAVENPAEHLSEHVWIGKATLNELPSIQGRQRVRDRRNQKSTYRGGRFTFGRVSISRGSTSQSAPQIKARGCLGDHVASGGIETMNDSRGLWMKGNAIVMGAEPR